ncbi:type II toxin-antitoxin system VapC family toxin [Nesterenkonia alkaliphila]|uniref:Ribonuclease VapC n=1 Tax=Nesterenkonia alkaliphila TaxID=1463631 RepID=A0A7K1UKW9_9MICC|nr:PIN domain-containing protein [Nesterenkonia alkaliphila]MVT27137.1 PIN domain-containing protein [Nesterenkonia alkaliphila]
MILVDTGVLVALVSEADGHHQRCRDWFATVDRAHLLVPATVIAEACYMITVLKGSEVEATFLQDLADGAYGKLLDITPADLQRMSHLVSQYKDLPLGGTDASVVALAERLGSVEVATVDHRHFSVVRPRHSSSFSLLPPVP